MFKFLFLSLISFCLGDYCTTSTLQVSECQYKTTRDLLFIVDGSNSMIKMEFYTSMMDFVQSLFCAFSPEEDNQVGMIVFNKDIKTLIPMSNYTREEWKSLTDDIRSQENQLGEPCCSCCTPTADAFDLAKTIFTQYGRSQLKIAFVITDGVPSSNDVGSEGNPEWLYVSNSKGFNPARYNAEIVSQQANELKALGVRVALVGVPSKFGFPPDVEFFTGTGIWANTPRVLTMKRRGLMDANEKTWSYVYNKPPNPIVSFPINKNAFSSPTWNVTSLVLGTVDAICDGTMSPSNSPTKIPSLVPSSKIPTKTPSNAPMFRPSSFVPTSYQPTFNPTSLRPTSNSPISMLPSFLPTHLPTYDPSLKPTMVPTLLPTSQNPSTRPSFSPSFLPTSVSPSSIPTLSPSVNLPRQIDLTFIIDRSNSMNDRNKFCGEVISTLPDVFKLEEVTKSFCWELFMRYILEQSEMVANLPSSNHGGIIGWAKQYNTTGYGLRVQVIGFACENNQKTPKMFEYSEYFGNGKPIQDVHMLTLMLDILRVEVLPSGGTCPGLSIEQTVKYVERASYTLYPNQVTILVTDGIFYDMPFPTRAVKGLAAYQVLRIAVGISVAKQGNSYGLTQNEIHTQREQLTGFVSSPKNYLDLGQMGWEILLKNVTTTVLESIKSFQEIQTPIPRNTWCGWRRISSCQENEWKFNHCKWILSPKKSWGCREKI